MSHPAFNLLKAMSLFTEFTDTELEALCGLVETTHVPAGQCIVRQDEPGDCMYLVVEGKAKVVHRRGDKQVQLATLAPGDFFGELALVDEGPRSANVEALEDCTLVKLERGVVRALAGIYPAAAFKLLLAVGRTLVLRMRAGNQKYIDSLLASARG